MSRSGQAYVAATMGTDFTLYAVMRAMGLHITPEQEKFQAYLESIYPKVVEKKEGTGCHCTGFDVRTES